MEHSDAVTTSRTAAIDAVCWDWNGTLLDDTEVARAAMNTVLAERGLPVVPDPAAYRALFGFPVQAFYERLGISDIDFRVAAGRYLELFAALVDQARLQTEAVATLSAITRLGVEQVLISATVPETLHRQMAPHAIDEHFVQILGITDAYVPSNRGAGAVRAHDPRSPWQRGLSANRGIGVRLGRHDLDHTTSRCRRVTNWPVALSSPCTHRTRGIREHALGP